MKPTDRIEAWLATQMVDADHVRVSNVEQDTFGHSAETILLTIMWRDSGGAPRQEAVIRVRPRPPGLLEPYDLQRQFDVLRRLQSTPVRAPRPLWLEPTGEVLGREFYVMARLPGEVYEQGLPAEVAGDSLQIRRMSESFTEQLAAIHTVGLGDTGLDTIGDGSGFLRRELDHWESEVRRVQRGPLPALEQLILALRHEQPEQCPSVTLVHGDAKPGNFAFQNGEVSGVFDWEGAAIGDPLSDMGWAEVVWTLPGSFTTQPGALSREEFVSRWEELTGIKAQHRAWYRAFQAFKMTAIQLVAGHLFRVGHSEDPRFKSMGHAFKFMTNLALRELGIEPAQPERSTPAPENRIP